MIIDCVEDSYPVTTVRNKMMLIKLICPSWVCFAGAKHCG